MVSLEFLLAKSFQPSYHPGANSASNRNEYQKYFLEGKGVQCEGLKNLPPSCANCLEIWSLNLLEHAGPFQDCTWIAFLYFTFKTV
jgi:hypothetical protein